MSTLKVMQYDCRKREVVKRKRIKFMNRDAAIKYMMSLEDQPANYRGTLEFQCSDEAGRDHYGLLMGENLYLFELW